MKKKVYGLVISLIVIILCVLYCGHFDKVYANDNNQLIQDGVYFFETGVDSSKVLDVINAYTYSGANVQIFTKNNEAKCQKIKVKYLGDGYYNFFFEHSSKALDVANAETRDHTNVWQCNVNGADAQKWKIVDAGNGYYNIISKSANKYLTVANGGTSNCTNIEIDSYRGNLSQSFKFVNAESANLKEINISEGTYEIQTGVKENKVLDVIAAYMYSGANVQIYERNNCNAQRIRVTKTTDGYYNFTFVHSEKLIDVANAETKDHTNVWQCNANGADAQKWKIYDAGNGYCYIKSKSAEKFLTVANGKTENCTNIEINSFTGNESQMFKFNKKNELNEINISEGIYEIQTGVKDNKVLDVIAAYMYSGANVQIYERNNCNAQRIRVTKTTDGYYNFTFVHSEKLIDVANGETKDHTNVWQCNVNGADAQKWKIYDAGNGYCYIESKSAKKYLTVANGKTDNCTNIEINSYKGDAAQKFKFNKQNKLKEIEISEGIYEVQTGVKEDRVLDVIAAYMYSGANVQIYERNNCDAQRIKVAKTTDGYYTLTFVHSGKVLDVANAETKDHTNVWQCNVNGADAQKWKIYDAGNGYCYIESKSAKKYLTVADGKTDNCTNIEINSFTGNSSQIFKFNLETENTILEIEEGLYEIESLVDSNKAIEVVDGRTFSGANVRINNKNNKSNQKVIVEKTNDGYYNLVFLHSGLLLDVANAEIKDYTNVWECNRNGADAQKWYFKDAKNGYINIVSKLSETLLTVGNENNIEIQQGTGHELKQKFKLKRINETYGYRTIKDGTYEIEINADSNKVLDVINAYNYSGANVQIFKKNDANCQKIQVEYQKDGYYTLKFVHSNKVLDVANAEIKDHTNVWQCNKNGADAQKWYIKAGKDGYYYIMSKLSGTYLTVAGSTDNCTNVEINQKSDEKYQLFKFNETKVNNIVDLDENKYPGYKDLINKMVADHPNWKFEFLYTGISFNDAVYGEYSNHSANLVSTDSGNEWICPICGTKLYDTGWYGASSKAIAYYMDPRNFLNDSSVFSFLDVNKYESSSVSYEGIQVNVAGTFLEPFVNDIDGACRTMGVNPYFVIARLIQENGRKGSTTSKGMADQDGKIYYNPFNIGASGNSTQEVIDNARAKAKSNGWDTMEKALCGGIQILKNNWLDNDQNTLYQNKFDIDKSNGSALYAHQYMQNLSAAYTEGLSLKGYYVKANTINSNLTFKIPLYEGMPQTLSPRPSDVVSTEEYPMNVVVNTESTSLALRSEASTSSTVIARYEKGTVLLSVKRGINSDWQKVVTKDGKVGYMSGAYLKQVNDEFIVNYKAYVKTQSSGQVNVRTGPSTTEGFAKVDCLPDYTNVTVVDDKTYWGYEVNNWVQWCRIILEDGRQAFIPLSYIRR